MASTTDTQTEITLKGSVDIVSEFFFTAINSILYQRGTYIAERNPPEGGVCRDGCVLRKIPDP
jgi:hypothetical protein